MPGWLSTTYVSKEITMQKFNFNHYNILWFCCCKYEVFLMLFLILMNILILFIA
jgi:hypothetical protein